MIKPVAVIGKHALHKSNKMIASNRTLPVCIFLSVSLISLAQETKNKLTFEGIASAFADSKRHFNFNENNHMYYEARLGYEINKYFEVNAFAGYKLKNYIYFAEKNGNQLPLFMERHYVPVGISIRLYISDFLYEKIHLWKNANRWDVYNQLGFAVLAGKDIHDPMETNFSSQGYYVPFYLYPYVRKYGRPYLTYLFGVRYNPGHHFGLFAEGGGGALNDVQIGARVRF